MVITSLSKYFDLVLLLFLQRFMDPLVIEIQHVESQGLFESWMTQEYSLKVHLFDCVALHFCKSFDEILTSALIQDVEPTYDSTIP